MNDRREAILATKRGFSSKEGWMFPMESVKDAMDEYMRECCLELLEYIANNHVECDVLSDIDGDSVTPYFYFDGNWITKEQLFENFL